jgi:hypothetical protein
MISLFLAGMCLVNDEFPGVQSRLLLDYARRPRGKSASRTNTTLEDLAGMCLSNVEFPGDQRRLLLDYARSPRGESASRTLSFQASSPACFSTALEDLAGSAPRKENFAGAVLDIV